MRASHLLLPILIALPVLASAREPVVPPDSELIATPPGAVEAEVLAALEARVELPATPPTLPDQASERAREAHQNTAFGKQGQRMRDAHAQSANRARRQAAATARAEARARGQERAREAAARAHGNGDGVPGSGNADSERAAGRARSEAARGNGPSDLPRPGGR